MFFGNPAGVCGGRKAPHCGCFLLVALRLESGFSLASLIAKRNQGKRQITSSLVWNQKIKPRGGGRFRVRSPWTASAAALSTMHPSWRMPCTPLAAVIKTPFYFRSVWMVTCTSINRDIDNHGKESYSTYFSKNENT